MKQLRQLLSKKNINKQSAIDEHTIAFVFKEIMREEYGKRGAENLQVSYFKDKKLFVKAENSNWANELWMSKKNIIIRINNKFGSEEIIDITLS